MIIIIKNHIKSEFLLKLRLHLFLLFHVIWGLALVRKVLIVQGLVFQQLEPPVLIVAQVPVVSWVLGLAPVDLRTHDGCSDQGSSNQADPSTHDQKQGLDCLVVVQGLVGEALQGSPGVVLEPPPSSKGAQEQAVDEKRWIIYG